MYPSDEETEAWVAMNLVMRSIHSEMDSKLRARALPRLRWYDVLWAIERAGPKGLRPYELEEALIFEQSNLSRLLQRLGEEALVTETKAATDQRGKIFHITGKGRQLRKQMWAIYGPLIHSHMQALSKGVQLRDLAAALDKVREQGAS